MAIMESMDILLSAELSSGRASSTSFCGIIEELAERKGRYHFSPTSCS